jgi:hypothetical protein
MTISFIVQYYKVNIDELYLKHQQGHKMCLPFAIGGVAGGPITPPARFQQAAELITT